ncbi:hypothetical protein [Paraburkholderia fungorum]|jgi:hypothetical protein|uniref:hypothetical protein n=1 Tax=Paraburkholderia fungorum TaxID=134537 RepID=UPI0038783DF2
MKSIAQSIFCFTPAAWPESFADTLMLVILRPTSKRPNDNALMEIKGRAGVVIHGVNTGRSHPDLRDFRVTRAVAFCRIC